MIDLLSNPAHLHLLLNHVPTVGFGVGLVLFLVAWTRDLDDLLRTSLALLFLVAVATIATYVTGNAADGMLRGAEQVAAYPPGIAPAAIRSHEDAAFLAFAAMEVTGFFAWLALWHSQRAAQFGRCHLAVVLACSLATFGLVARAATKGGEISHMEVRPEVVARHNACLELQETASTKPELRAPYDCRWQAVVEDLRTATDAASTNRASSDAGLARSIGAIVIGKDWVWPTLETLHFIGLSMLFTAVVVINLRMLGLIRQIPYSAVHQLMPIGMLGFGLNLVTGMLFFIGVPGQYVHNVTFFWKIAFVLAGGVNVTYFLLDGEAWRLQAGDDAAWGSKLAAASAIGIWVAVLFCGHMLPFIGNAF